MNADHLPETPRQLVRLGGSDRWRIPVVASVLGAIGYRKYPMPAEGDLEKMGVVDKAYWFSKSDSPIRRARKGSGLETYFRRQTELQWSPPIDFVPESEITIAAAGDLIPHTYLRNSGDSLYSNIVNLLFGPDISMASLEGTLSPQVGQPYEFTSRSAPAISFDPDEFAVLRGPGGKRFGFLATASNHSLDFGEKGVDYTLEQLGREGITTHGLNAEEPDADRATLIECRGVRIAVVAWTFGTNGYHPPEHRPRIVNRADLNASPPAADLSILDRQIRWSREQGADFVIVQLHWGLEYEFYPTPEQVEMAHWIAEMGADAIIGHHPHVIQPFEGYRTSRDHRRIVPIFYSLGNLVNYFSAEYLCESMIAELTLLKGAISGSQRVYVRRAKGTRVRQTMDAARRKIRIQPVYN